MKINDCYTLYNGKSLLKKLANTLLWLLLLLSVQLKFSFNVENSTKFSFGTLFVAMLYYFTPRHFCGSFQRTIKNPYRMLEKNHLINLFICVTTCFVNTIVFNTVLISFGNESIQTFIFELSLDFLFCSLLPLFNFINNHILTYILLLITALIPSILSSLTFLDVKFYASIIIAGFGMVIFFLTNLLWIKFIRYAEKSLSQGGMTYDL